MLAAPQFLITMAMMLPEFRSMEYLGGARATGATTSITAEIKARQTLFLIGRCPGLSAADTLCMRMNNVSTVSYHWRCFTAPEFLGAVTFGNNQSGAGGADRMQLEQVATNLNRHFMMFMMNTGSLTKVAFYQSTYATNSLTTQPTLQLGTGEWVDTTAQTTSFTLLCAGAATMNTDTGFGIFGRDIP